jgi:hypothetical protein
MIQPRDYFVTQQLPPVQQALPSEQALLALGVEPTANAVAANAALMTRRWRYFFIWIILKV